MRNNYLIGAAIGTALSVAIAAGFVGAMVAIDTGISAISHASHAISHASHAADHAADDKAGCIGTDDRYAVMVNCGLPEYASIQLARGGSGSGAHGHHHHHNADGTISGNG